MNLFILIFFTTYCYAKYSVNHSIQTPFKNEKELINFISSTEFFINYLEEVGNENTTFTPSIQDKVILNNPQEIEYISNPNITLLPKLFKKIKIKQNWNRNENKFIGKINSFYISFHLIITSEFSDNILMLNFNATIDNKLFFVPNIALKYALQDFGNIFHKIIKIKNLNCY
tara:strand:+ start:283 stop:798 length:516 start_codon:yes stop_codon:yes gene_type:complete